MTRRLLPHALLVGSGTTDNEKRDTVHVACIVEGVARPAKGSTTGLAAQDYVYGAVSISTSCAIQV